MNTILNRLSEIERFPVINDSNWVYRDQSRQIIDQIENKIKNGILHKRCEYDISDINFDEAKSILLSNQILRNDDVFVVWNYESFGVVIPYNIFCQFFDELWYPSSDDVLVTDKKINNCVGISHEEKIVFWNIYTCLH